MGLSNDQRAMLRLLAQREEGYEDIAALMDISVDEVRARVKEALAELQDASPPKAAAPPPPAKPKPTPPPAIEVTDPPPPAAPLPPSPRRSSPASPRLSLFKGPRRRLELFGGALVALLILLFATGAVDLGDNDSESEPTTTASRSDGGGQGGIAAVNPKFTQALLEPAGGGEARGLAQFGKVKGSAVLQVEAEGLEPSSPGESYTVWFYRSPKLVLRVGAVRVTDSGGIAAQFPIPTRLLGVIVNRTFDQIDVSLTTDAAYAAEVAEAKRQNRLPVYTGTSVLRGEIAGPLVQ